ncbi:hypothetical protein NQ318_009642, partial [Aromia moschata]
MLKEVYGNECLSRTHIFEWFKRFCMNRSTKFAQKWCQNSLTPEQKESRMNICADILTNIDTDLVFFDS